MTAQARPRRWIHFDFFFISPMFSTK